MDDCERSTNVQCCVSPAVTSNNTDGRDYVLDTNDRINLIAGCDLKENKSCRCTVLKKYESNTINTKPWISFIHILCTVRTLFSYIISFKVLK